MNHYLLQRLLHFLVSFVDTAKEIEQEESKKIQEAFSEFLVEYQSQKRLLYEIEAQVVQVYDEMQ
jgi:hypothetical protein